MTHNERPILFNGAMVRAILAGRKTQTRRVMKGDAALLDAILPDYAARCRYGQPGDRLWVRETLRRWGSQWVAYDAGNTPTTDPNVLWRWRGDRCPSIHMPRALSRITLEITAVRVERLQDISEADAESEGVDYIPAAPARTSHRAAFAGLWDGINGKTYPWASNPWVWVVEFKPL